MNIPATIKKVKRRNKKHGSFREKNYFYRLFDAIGTQLTLVNQGLKDQGLIRTYQFK